MHYMLFYMQITCSIIQHNPITCSITCHLHDQLHAITCSTVLLHAPLHANYMINYMLDYMQHHSITCSITWQLHNQLHDLLHTQLPLHALNGMKFLEPMITCFLRCLPRPRSLPPSAPAVLKIVVGGCDDWWGACSRGSSSAAPNMKTQGWSQ
jgi:hypothetical protein